MCCLYVSDSWCPSLIVGVQIWLLVCVLVCEYTRLTVDVLSVCVWQLMHKSDPWCVCISPPVNNSVRRYTTLPEYKLYCSCCTSFTVVVQVCRCTSVVAGVQVCGYTTLTVAVSVWLCTNLTVSAQLWLIVCKSDWRCVHESDYGCVSVEVVSPS